MKTLILTRHAKSDWSNLQLKDFDRELNERGLRDAPMMGRRLKQHKLQLDLFVSSTAKRAAQTCELILNELLVTNDRIVWNPNLYHASPHQIESVIFEQPNDKHAMLLVCHNPGITDYANQLTGFVTIEMPTCSMCAFQFETDKWENIRLAKSKLLFFDFPKNIA